MQRYMKPFFGGLWAPIRAQATTPIRPAILFLGDNYFVRFHLSPSDKTISILSRTYIIEGNEVYYSSMYPEEEGDETFSFKWKVTEDGLLEFEQGGRKTLWEPVTAEEMAEEGYPIGLFQKYRKAYADEGHLHTIEGLVPDLSTTDKSPIEKPKKKGDR